MARTLSETDRGTWEQRGGRIRYDSKGRPVFILRKQIAGRRFEISTKRHTLAAALAEWEKFERFDVLGKYEGPDVVLDFDARGILVGIEIV